MSWRRPPTPASSAVHLPTARERDGFEDTSNPSRGGLLSSSCIRGDTCGFRGALQLLVQGGERKPTAQRQFQVRCVVDREAMHASKGERLLHRMGRGLVVNPNGQALEQFHKRFAVCRRDFVHGARPSRGHWLLQAATALAPVLLSEPAISGYFRLKEKPHPENTMSW